MLLEAGAEGVDLRAGGAEAGDFEDGGGGWVGPMWRRVPSGRLRRSRPRVRMFSPSSPGARAKPLAASSSSISAAKRWTWQRLGCGGVLALEVEVLDGAAAVGVAFDAFVGDEGYAVAAAWRSRGWSWWRWLRPWACSSHWGVRVRVCGGGVG